MKGPHFFEKRKKEMARQEKAKQKADRKAQRKAGKGKDGEGGEGDESDEFLDVEGLGSGSEGQADSESGDSQVGTGSNTADAQTNPSTGASLRDSGGG
jgi:hypothetical protein